MDLSESGLHLGDQPRDREAQLLARLIRASRLTLLRGAPGVGKTTLLRDGVMPLLQRRDSDSDLSRTRVRRGPQATAASERRGRSGEDRGVAEIALCFSEWDAESPVAALREQILDALHIAHTGLAPPSLALHEGLPTWGRALGIRFLIALDGFERVLAARADQSGLNEFADLFARLATLPDAPVHFLVAVDDGVEGLVDGFRQRVPGFGDASVRLLPLPQGVPAKAPGATVPNLTDALQQAPPPAGAVRPTRAGSTPAARVPPARRRPVSSLGWAATAAVVVIAAFLGHDVWQARSRPPMVAGAVGQASAPGPAAPVTAPEPSDTASTSAAAAPPAVDPSLPALELSIDASSGSDPQVARDLAMAVAPQAGQRLLVRADGQTAGPSTSGTVPPMALLLWDALGPAAQARADGSNPGQSLKVVMPLFTEEIHVLVRHDSALVHLHDLQGRRINLRPAGTGSEITASKLYERMFGGPVAPAQASYLGDDEALRRLLDDGSIDAMVVVAAQPAQWLALLPPDVARQFRLLSLDPQHPASQRAIETYLPTVVRAASYQRWLGANVPTLASMSFLATFAEADPDGAQRVADFALALCRNLPALRRGGHPKWREVQPDFQPETGWPYSPSARQALRDCTSDGAVAAAGDTRR